MKDYYYHIMHQISFSASSISAVVQPGVDVTVQLRQEHRI